MKSSLLAFILLSALVHAVVFSLRDESPIVLQEIKEQGGSLIHIDLAPHIITPPESTQQAEKKTSHNKLDAPPARTEPLVLSNTHDASKKIVVKKERSVADSLNLLPIPKKETNNAKTKNQLATVTSASLSTQAITPIDNSKKIARALNSELAKHFHYPKSALRRHREGKVLLSFEINAKGEINNILIKKSSGYEILDNAAINSVKKINVHEELEHLLSEKTSYIDLPVIYDIDE